MEPHRHAPAERDSGPRTAVPCPGPDRDVTPGTRPGAGLRAVPGLYRSTASRPVPPGRCRDRGSCYAHRARRPAPSAGAGRDARCGIVSAEPPCVAGWRRVAARRARGDYRDDCRGRCQCRMVSGAGARMRHRGRVSRSAGSGGGVRAAKCCAGLGRWCSRDGGADRRRVSRQRHMALRQRQRPCDMVGRPLHGQGTGRVPPYRCGRSAGHPHGAVPEERGRGPRRLACGGPPRDAERGGTPWTTFWSRTSSR